MSATRARWRRLGSGLAPSERMALLLRAWKQGEEADPTILRDVPDAQHEPMQRLLALNRAINTHLGWLPVSLNQDVIQLWTQLALAASVAFSSGLPAAQPLLDDVGERAARTWGEAKALEMVASEVAGELGEDPFHPEVRAALDRVSSELVAMAALAADLPGVSVVLAEPTGDDLARLDAFVKRVLRR